MMQLHFDFPGVDGERSVDRLFLALSPPADTAAWVFCIGEQLRRDLGLHGKLIAPPRLHVSLHALGHSVCGPRDLVAAANEAASSIQMPQFDVVFDRVMSFDCKRRDQPFVLRASHDLAALVDFHRALGAAMMRVGLGRWVSMHFTPHMTLLYDKHVVAQRPVEPVRWTVRDFVLVHSLVGQSQHRHLAHWPLQG